MAPLARYLHKNTDLLYNEDTKTITATLTVSVTDGIRLVRSSDNNTIAVGIPEKLGGEVSLINCNENYMLDILKEQRYNVLECLSTDIHDNWEEKSCTATWVYNVEDAAKQEEPAPEVVKVEEQTPIKQKSKLPNTKIK